MCYPHVPYITVTSLSMPLKFVEEILETTVISIKPSLIDMAIANDSEWEDQRSEVEARESYVSRYLLVLLLSHF